MTTGTYGSALRNGFDRMTQIDTSIAIAVRRWRAPWLSRVMTALTRAGDPQSWVAHALALALLTQSARLVVLLATGALLALGTSQILKRAFPRTRPGRRIADFVAILEDPDAFSFPSGHTTVAFAVAAAISTASPRVALAELVLATAIGFSRVYLGAHYPADVIAGAALGVASGLIAALGCSAAGLN